VEELPNGRGLDLPTFGDAAQTVKKVTGARVNDPDGISPREEPRLVS
jgi:hypothetical protein